MGGVAVDGAAEGTCDGVGGGGPELVERDGDIPSDPVHVRDELPLSACDFELLRLANTSGGAALRGTPRPS